MKSLVLGPSTSPVEVTNVSTHGFWLFIGERELFVSFLVFPVVQRSVDRERLLRWNFRARIICTGRSWMWISLWNPSSILKKYPLVSQARSNKALQPTSRARSAGQS